MMSVVEGKMSEVWSLARRKSPQRSFPKGGHYIIWGRSRVDHCGRVAHASLRVSPPRFVGLRFPALRLRLFACDVTTGLNSAALLDMVDRVPRGAFGFAFPLPLIVLCWDSESEESDAARNKLSESSLQAVAAESHPVRVSAGPV